MKKTILFVDDEEINLFVLQRRFDPDYNVLTASCAEDAIKIISEQKDHLDAVITDLKMPEKSGLEIVQEMKEDLKGIPCFLLTGYDYNPEIENAINSGAISRLFKKPFNYNEISMVLKEFLIDD